MEAFPLDKGTQVKSSKMKLLNSRRERKFRRIYKDPYLTDFEVSTLWSRWTDQSAYQSTLIIPSYKLIFKISSKYIKCAINMLKTITWLWFIGILTEVVINFKPIKYLAFCMLLKNGRIPVFCKFASQWRGQWQCQDSGCGDTHTLVTNYAWHCSVCLSLQHTFPYDFVVPKKRGKPGELDAVLSLNQSSLLNLGRMMKTIWPLFTWVVPLLPHLPLSVYPAHGRGM